MFKTGIIALGILFATFNVANAQSWVNCKPREYFDAYLGGSKYKEEVVVLGVDQYGNVLEMWTNAAHSSWSVTVTNKSTGLACLIAAGEDLTIKDGNSNEELKKNNSFKGDKV